MELGRVQQKNDHLKCSSYVRGDRKLKEKERERQKMRSH